LNLIEFINKFKKPKNDNMKYAEMLNGYIPIFSQFGQDIYASDVVQQAISCLVTELTKVNSKFKVFYGEEEKDFSPADLISEI